MKRNVELMFDKPFFIIIISWATCAIFFGIYDLQISDAMVNETSTLGGFGRDYGELPSYGLIAACIILCIGFYFDSVKSRRTVSMVGLIIGIVTILFGILIHNTPLILIACAISFSIAILLAFTTKIEWDKDIELARMVLYLALIVPFLFVRITKMLSGRVRYCDLVPDHSNFTPWYEFQGLDFHNSSFPSGHTAMAWMFLPLAIFLWKGDYTRRTRIMGTALIVGWGILVSISRVIIGAHYASDVLFSTGMAVTVTYLLSKMIYPKKQ